MGGVNESTISSPNHGVSDARHFPTWLVSGLKSSNPVIKWLGIRIKLFIAKRKNWAIFRRDSDGSNSPGAWLPRKYLQIAQVKYDDNYTQEPINHTRNHFPAAKIESHQNRFHIKFGQFIHWLDFWMYYAGAYFDVVRRTGRWARD